MIKTLCNKYTLLVSLKNPFGTSEGSSGLGCLNLKNAKISNSDLYTLVTNLEVVLKSMKHSIEWAERDSCRPFLHE